MNKLIKISASIFILCCWVAVHSQTVSEVEWWFDNQYSSPQRAAVGAVNTLWQHDIPTHSLTEGIHVLNMRLKDNTGVYSPVSSSYFLKLNRLGASGVKKVEFWFDDDFEQAQSVIAPPNGWVNIPLPTGDIEQGLHTLKYRVGYSNGVMGSVCTDYFLKLNAFNKVGTRILEYWFDDNYNNRMKQAVNGSNHLIVPNINTSSLSLGGHSLSFRIGYEGGVFSPESKAYFVKGQNPYAETNSDPLTVTGYTYWFDNDTAVSVSRSNPSATYRLVTKPDASQLDPNRRHAFHIQFRRSDGAQSMVVKDSFKLSEDIITVNNPVITLSRSIVQAGETLEIRGNNFTPGGYVSFSCLPVNNAIGINPLYADGEGRITANVTIANNCSEGLYSVLATNQSNGRQTISVDFRVKSQNVYPAESSIHIVYPNNPNIICKTGNELIVLWEDFLSLDNRYQIFHENATREYRYWVELKEWNPESGSGEVIDDEELDGAAPLNKTGQFQHSFYPSKEGYYTVRIEDKVSEQHIESAPFFIETHSGQLNIVKKWDYSSGVDESLLLPIKSKEPKGVAADGTSRIYLAVSAKGKSIKNLSLTLKAEQSGYNDTRLLGKVMAATVIDRYNNEANNANSTTAVNNTAGLNEYYFWYVAPDDFTGNDADKNESTRLVKAVFDVTFTDNTTAQEYSYIEIVRPALMLVHGLGSSHECWSNFSLREGINVVAEDGYIIDKRFTVAEAIDVWPEVAFEQNARGLLGDITPKTAKSTFEAINLLMMNKGYASNRVDYICHSMGGCILRYAIEYFPDLFYSNKNYGKGFTNKVITINTPHEGSPLGDVVEIAISALVDLPFVYNYLAYRYNNFSKEYADQERVHLEIPFSWIRKTVSVIEIELLDKIIGVNTFERTDAVKDLSLRDGKRFYKTDAVKAHLIAGDIFDGIQGLYTIPSNIDYDMFGSSFLTSSFFFLLEELLPFYIGTEGIKIMFIENENERRIAVYNAYAGLVYAGLTNFVYDSDMVVPLESQLAGDFNLPNATILSDGWDKLHTSIVNIAETGKVVEDLLQSPINTSKFGSIPASVKAKSGLRKARQLPALKSTANTDTDKLEMITPVTGATVNNTAETMTVELLIKDLESLEYIDIHFQGKLYRHFNISEANRIFNIPVDPAKPDEQLVMASAHYFYPDSIYTAYTGAYVDVVMTESPLGMSCSRQVFRCGKGDVVRPGYEVVYPTYIYRFGVNKDLHAQILGEPVVEFNADDCSFTAKEYGTTYVELDYQGLKDTIYIVVDPTIASNGSKIDEFESKNGSASTLVIYPNPVVNTFSLCLNNPNNEKQLVSIYNVQGQKIESKEVSGNAATFDIAHYPQGIYFIRVVTQSGETLSGKLIKQDK